MSTQIRQAVTDTLPALFPSVFAGFGDSGPLDLPPVTAQVERQIGELFVSGDFNAWSQALSRVGNCAKPVRLHGFSENVDLVQHLHLEEGFA